MIVVVFVGTCHYNHLQFIMITGQGAISTHCPAPWPNYLDLGLARPFLVCVIRLLLISRNYHNVFIYLLMLLVYEF